VSAGTSGSLQRRERSRPRRPSRSRGRTVPERHDQEVEDEGRGQRHRQPRALPQQGRPSRQGGDGERHGGQDAVPPADPQASQAVGEVPDQERLRARPHRAPEAVVLPQDDARRREHRNGQAGQRAAVAAPPGVGRQRERQEREWRLHQRPDRHETARDEVGPPAQAEPVGAQHPRGQVRLREQAPRIVPERCPEERQRAHDVGLPSGGVELAEQPATRPEREERDAGRAHEAQRLDRPAGAPERRQDGGEQQGKPGRVHRVFGPSGDVDGRPGAPSRLRTTLRVAVPRPEPFEHVDPVHAGAVDEPDRVVVERSPGEPAAGVPCSLMRGSVVVGEIQVPVVDEAVDHDQVVWLVARLDAGDPDLAPDAVASGHDQREKQEHRDHQGHGRLSLLRAPGNERRGRPVPRLLESPRTIRRASCAATGAASAIPRARSCRPPWHRGGIADA
jgi:hypothetical protein